MSAQQAKEGLDGWDLYEGFNTLRIEYANVSPLRNGVYNYGIIALDLTVSDTIS
jgi:hypothetical protein